MDSQLDYDNEIEYLKNTERRKRPLNRLIMWLIEALHPVPLEFRRLEIEIPIGFCNCRVTHLGHFRADTNDPTNWDEIKFPLPDGKWKIHKINGKFIELRKYT